MTKSKRADLAFLGGIPAFKETLHVGRPNIGDSARILERVSQICGRRWLTNDGPLVHEFEQRVADLLGVKHCVAICNATVALEITTRALGLSGEVIVPSFTFVATAHVLQWQGITPVFADIDPISHNLDPAQVEQLITPRTTGIIGVHLWGRPCDVESLSGIAAHHGLKILFDAAHAFGCSHRGRMIGGFGQAEVFSFHATKVVNSFEGGAVVTNDDELARAIRLMRNFGFSGYDTVTCLGLNGKMTEVCAAMGLTSIEAMPEIVAINQKNWETYRESFAEMPGLSLVEYDPNERNNYHYVVMEIDPDKAPLSRDELEVVLHAENVLARKYFWPGCHRMAPYDSLYPNASLRLSATESLASRVLVLPTGQAITPEIIAKIGNVVGTAFKNADEVRKLLRERPGRVPGDSIRVSDSMIANNSTGLGAIDSFQGIR